jgi:hypothetical protein
MSNGQAWRVLTWYARYVFNRLEWQHTLSIGLFSLWAMTVAFVDYPLYVETRALSSRLARPIRLDAATRKPASQRDMPRDLVKEFVASLPEFQQYPEQLRALNDLVDRNGIAARHIDYRYERVPSLAIQKLALQMELSGQEIPLRKFMQVALNSFSNLSIASLSFAKAADGGASAELRLEKAKE